MSDLYVASGILNFFCLMAFWVYRCITIHETKSDIMTCLAYGLMGAIVAGFLGFVATITIGATVLAMITIEKASGFILSLKNKDK